MNNTNEYNSAYTIFALLPYSEEAELLNKHQKINDLYLIKSVADFCIFSLEHFITGNLQDFDAQVGENLCQIRAYKILYLANKWLISADTLALFKKEIERLYTYKQQLEEIIFEWENNIKHSSSYNKNLDAPEKVFQFLTRNQLLINLHEELVFIVTCCFLTHFNVHDGDVPVAINLDYITREFHISKYRAGRLTHKYQQMVCKMGCDFILTIARELPVEAEYEKMLTQLYKISEGRMILPCYLVSEIIFYHSIQSKIPVLMIVKRIDENKLVHDALFFLLQGSDEKNNYSLVASEPYWPSYCLVVSGRMESKIESIDSALQHILKESPLKIMLANTASHPQYSGKQLNAFRFDPYIELPVDDPMIEMHRVKLRTLQDYALNIGCTQHNQATFFLKHVYANNVLNELNRLKTNHNYLVYNAYNRVKGLIEKEQH